MSEPVGHTFVTARQATIHALFVKHRSMSEVARALNVTQIRVREALVQHERNRMRDVGIQPPPLRDMLKGDVTTRLGVPRSEFGGRPAKHVQLDERVRGGVLPTSRKASKRFAIGIPQSGVKRYIITSVEPDLRVHAGFWRNLKAYAAACNADLLVFRLGSVGPRACVPSSYADHLVTDAFGIEGLLDVALDERIPARMARPLEGIRRSSACWTIIGHPAVQFETLPRLRADGYKAQLTTGCMSLPRNSQSQNARELGAVIIEVVAGGAVHCRHILTPTDGDGSFQDLDARVSRGAVRYGCRVEALTFGDIHHKHMDPEVAVATWGLGATRACSGLSLVDRLRPRHMVFHDVCDFDSRNHHDRRNHLRRFVQMAGGGGDVAAELKSTARFLESTRRKWSQSIVVNSNHDDALIRWLKESDFREDPINALFFLEASLQLHTRLAAGKTEDDFFEQTLRRVSSDQLAGVRFLRTGESYKIAGIEAGIHGHLGADGRQGDVRFFERLGIKATLGHTHRPLTRNGIYCTGVCQANLEYAKGAVTGWGVGHVVNYSNGARQHLILIDGAFHG